MPFLPPNAFARTSRRVDVVVAGRTIVGTVRAQMVAMMRVVAAVARERVRSNGETFFDVSAIITCDSFSTV
jgi:hypothetical protein